MATSSQWSAAVTTTAAWLAAVSHAWNGPAASDPHRMRPVMVIDVFANLLTGDRSGTA